MGNDLERRAVQRLIDKAAAMGIQAPPEVKAIVCGDRSNNGAILWVNANPDRAEEVLGCCIGDGMFGAEQCTCWRPVFDIDQAVPIPLGGPADLEVRDRMCDDCAFRKDSPERADAYMEETLLSLPDEGEPFWCHDGMRRPVRWEHPDGRTVPGDSADWQPAMVGKTPFRADGRPGLLCAGWAARAARAEVRS